MADGVGPAQPADRLGVRKVVADQAEVTLGAELVAVERDNAGSLLAAVLQGMQAERGNGGGVVMAENAEHAAFLVEAVAFDFLAPEIPGGCVAVGTVAVCVMGGVIIGVGHGLGSWLPGGGGGVRRTGLQNAPGTAPRGGPSMATTLSVT